MSRPARPRRVKGAMPARSVRVSNEVWDKARRRAEREEVTVSHAAFLLLDGYAQGLLNLPRITIDYSNSSPGDTAAV